MRRLERQALAALGESLLDLGECGAAARRHHELARLVIDDAGIGACIDDFAARRVAVEVLAAAAAQSQREPSIGGVADPVAESLERQKRGSSGCGSLPPWTCMRPYSAQRASVGTAFPGLSKPCRSNACFTA